MNWKRRVAKEWLWFICTIIGGIIFWSILIFGLVKPKDAGDTFGIFFFVTIVGVYLIRSIFWSVRQLRKKSRGPE
jgi:hypothetical protein